MCGIAGLITRDPETRIAAMMNAIEHRGRDDEGVWTSGVIDEEGGQVCFGFRRLAIIDTSSAGHQPMLSHDGRFVVMLNGEIYNYRELRAQLESKGHSFRTQTDTEVLLEAWREWGDECLSHLNGMFAFALWDDQERALYLVRDHVGIKPLYYSYGTRTSSSANGGRDARVPNAFLFASEIKAILASGLIKAGLDREALHQFLTFLWAPDPNTLFRGIKTVPPGHFAKVQNGQLTLHQWWDISFDEIDEGKSEACGRSKCLKLGSRGPARDGCGCAARIVSLGGVDSSSIVALMKQHSNGRPVGTIRSNRG